MGVNTDTKYKAMYKSELARAAGVSTRTFNRWCITQQEELKKLNCSARCQLFNPSAVRYVCEHYGIVIDELQTG